MYVAIRPALRSSSLVARSPALSIRGRRYPRPQRVRQFHTTRPALAQTPTPTPSPDNTPVDESNGDKKAADKKDVEKEKKVEATAEPTADEQEVLAQKLQRSRELTRRYSSALRRTQRRNRATDLPPIHIPDWFLANRVRLREEAHPARTASSRRSDCTLSFTHEASGDHAAVSIPVSTYAAAFKAVSQMMKALWRRGMDEEQKKMLAEDFARRRGRDDEEFIKALLRGEEPRSGLWSEQTKPPPEAVDEMKDAIQAGIREANMREKILQDGRHISPLLLAEIRATIAASLATTQPSLTHSFPASKTNIILHSTSDEHEAVLSSAVKSLASELGADLVTLHAQDLAMLAGDYLGDGPDSSPHSIRSLGYETYQSTADFMDDVELYSREEPPEEDPEATEAVGPPRGPNMKTLGIKMHLFLGNSISDAFKKAAQNMGGSPSVQPEENANATSPFQPVRGTEAQLEDLKLTTLLEALMDTTDVKRSRLLAQSKNESSAATSKSASSKKAEKVEKTESPKLFDPSFETSDKYLDFSKGTPASSEALSFTVNNGLSTSRPQLPKKSKIIFIKDIKELNSTQYGGRIMQKLTDLVRKHRNAGESVMILGTTCSEDLTPELSPAGLQSLQNEGASGYFRTIVVTPGNVSVADDEFDLVAAAKEYTISSYLSRAQKKKNRDINIRHLQDMLRCLDPAASAEIANMERGAEESRRFMSILPDSLAWGVLPYADIHRIALAALGLRLLDPTAKKLSWGHVGIAIGLLKASDEVKYTYARVKAAENSLSLREQYRTNRERIKGATVGEPLRPGGAPAGPGQASKKDEIIARIKATATPHEKKLFSGIADSAAIKTGFDQIHVPKDTVDGIRTITSLSLLRPDAFNYGVLATEKVSGALLYGPPGTGKTLLAKAVAKESGCTVLEVSGSQIMDKYVGEGEKNVSAIFSLARKLSPCIVFLDEADAIFGTRDSSRERTSHRDILNQFLKEWDGLNDMSVFVMVATNRPFDMDDAVIRRLPRRLLVDLPTQEDRKKILEIHLRGEQLGEDVDLDDLAKRTPLYSGSDLKNVAVFAALACVREENENAAKAAAQAAQEAARRTVEALTTDAEKEGSSENDTTTSPSPSSTEQETASSPATTSTSPSSSSEPTTTSSTSETSTFTEISTDPLPSDATPTPPLVLGQSYTFPERRTLHKRHFDKALQEVSASVSENMSSLNAIKRFDEQYGDRKGRKKKSYGFGVGAEQPVEEAARVRS
ncbi:AAA-domain-containing protein [Sporormia fimetaria CBS 119925]|uniref:AAA-domain-containing protein n=1 Tax=Sporormia fimetaria CBS 119925 TaxID=1340428 RepID=A0A6A6VGX4_9PLEO|nr:AAA-domain-containing protein [Sporormia fimetaria CBS 119925]